MQVSYKIYSTAMVSASWEVSKNDLLHLLHDLHKNLNLEKDHEEYLVTRKYHWNNLTRFKLMPVLINTKLRRYFLKFALINRHEGPSDF